MKICYARDGKSIHDQRFLGYLASHGYDLHLLTFDPTSPQLPGVKLRYVESLRRYRIPRLMRAPFDGRRFRKVVNEIKPDVLHGHYVTTYGFYCAYSGYRPLLISAWGSDILISAKRSLLMRRVAQYVLRKADLATADSLALKNAMIRLGCPEEKIVLFPWGVDLQKFNRDVDRTIIRRKLGWTENPIVICNRWHRKVYGVENFVKAIPIILEAVPQTRFLVGGEGPLTDDLVRYVRERGLGKAVRFIGVVSHDEMPLYLRASDVYVSPSFSDSTSVALLEAMACGVAPVATDLEANKEWVRDSFNGYIVPPGDVKALADRVVALLRDSSQRKIFGERSYNVVKEKADWRDNMRILEEAYRSLAS